MSSAMTIAAVVGAGAQMYSANRAASNRPGQPAALPGPQTPGGISTNNMNAWYDPYTGNFNQYNYQFDPQSMQSQWDADAMYNQFMGMGNSNITNNIDWQIKKLTQDLERAKAPGKGANRGPQAADYGLENYVDPKTGKLAEWLADPDGIERGMYGAQGKGIHDEFIRATNGRYGGGFGNWLKDNMRINVQGLMDKYTKDQKTQVGNSENNDKTISDIQNQIDYLTGQKARYAPGGSGAAGNNPLLKYTNDTGPTWQGGGDNTNPYRQSWEEVMANKLAADKNSDPNSIYREYGLAGADGSNPQDLFQQKMSALLSGLPNYDRAKTDFGAPSLDLGSSGRMQNALNYRTQENYANQKASRDAQMARRGMASSAVNELAGARDSLALGAAMNENALNAANYFNDNTVKQFGMDAQAQGLNNAAVGQNNAAALARKGLQLQYTNDLEGTRFNQDMAKAQFAQNVKNNIFGQAMQSLNANNAMRNDEYARKMQDYTNATNENQRGYDRTFNMYNLLNGQRNNAFAQSMQRAGLGNQTLGTMMPFNMQMAGAADNANVANAQMQNSWQMANWQAQLQQNQAWANAISNMAGGVASGVGSYYGAQNSPANRIYNNAVNNGVQPVNVPNSPGIGMNTQDDPGASFMTPTPRSGGGSGQSGGPSLPFVSPNPLMYVGGSSYNPFLPYGGNR